MASILPPVRTLEVRRHSWTRKHRSVTVDADAFVGVELRRR
jgi:hypothetical protein